MYTDLRVGEQEYILIREDDVIGIMPNSNAVADDIPQLQVGGPGWGGPMGMATQGHGRARRVPGRRDHDVVP
jgi:hypothetical protein